MSWAAVMLPVLRQAEDSRGHGASGPVISKPTRPWCLPFVGWPSACAIILCLRMPLSHDAAVAFQVEMLCLVVWRHSSQGKARHFLPKIWTKARHPHHRMISLAGNPLDKGTVQLQPARCATWDHDELALKASRMSPALVLGWTTRCELMCRV